MDLLTSLLADGERDDVALVTVVATSGSTPRHAGARMAIAADGRRWGTIGGGRIEHEAEQIARAVAAGAPPQRIRRQLVRDLAMCCGGAMELVIAPMGSAGSASWQAVRAVVATLRDAPSDAWLLVTPLDGSPLAARIAAPGEAVPTSPRVAEGALVEPIVQAPRAVIFGAGHVGSALGPLCQMLGFLVVVCDDDDTGALAAADWADVRVDSFDVADLEHAIGPLSRRDYVLIVTRDHAVDQRVLESLLSRTDLGYLGMIGSRGKVARFRQRLDAKGLGDDAAWARLHAPVGLDIGAETPAEIAIAVTAQLIAVRNRHRSQPGTWRRKAPVPASADSREQS